MLAKRGGGRGRVDIIHFHPNWPTTGRECLHKEDRGNGWLGNGKDWMDRGAGTWTGRGWVDG